MRSGTLWLVVIASKHAAPIALVEQSKSQAVQVLTTLPKIGNSETLMFKLNLHRGRLYAKRQRFTRGDNSTQ